MKLRFGHAVFIRGGMIVDVLSELFADVVDRRQLQKILGVSSSLMSVWLQKGALPPPIRIGKKCFWNRGELVQALRNSQRTVTNAG
jgi:hypothetical protein